MSFESDWRAWHVERERLAGAEYGPSSLESTNWLISEPAAVEHVPGLWAAGADGHIHGSELGVAGATVTLRRGEALRFGRRELRVFQRRDAVALRVFNPARPQRERFSAIDAYRPDPAWRLPARFAPASDESITVVAIDEPADDGAAIIDFNRAYLPPCAFSDQYVCPLPPAGNRFSAPIRAGERAVVLGR